MHLDQSQDGHAETDQPMVRLGLVGRGIQLSRTPAMHEAEAEAHGLPCTYELLDTDAGTEDDLAAILSRAEAEGFAGLNVTYPYKQAVMEHLDQVSDAAGRIGAVNTVVFRDGGRFGHNTDFWGFSESVRRGLKDAPMDRVLFWVPQSGGVSLGVSLFSYAGTVVWGVSADRDRVPDPGRIVAFLGDALADLESAAGRS